jgi:hypothetical protein
MKQQARLAAAKPQARTHRATGTNLPAGICELLRRVAFERVLRSGGARSSVSALLVDLVNRHNGNSKTRGAGETRRWRFPTITPLCFEPL